MAVADVLQRLGMVDRGRAAGWEREGRMTDDDLDDDDDDDDDEDVLQCCGARRALAHGEGRVRRADRLR